MEETVMNLADLVAARQARQGKPPEAPPAAAGPAAPTPAPAGGPLSVEKPTTPAAPPHVVAMPARSRARDPLASIKGKVQTALLEALGPALHSSKLSTEEVEQHVKQVLQDVIEAEETPLTAADRNRLAGLITDEVLGHGPLEPLLRDPD